MGVITPNDVLDALRASLYDEDNPVHHVTDLIRSTKLPVSTTVDERGSVAITIEDDGTLLAPYLVALCAIARLAAMTDEPLSEVFLGLKGDLLHYPS